jgi:hypothetical protein
MEGKERGVSWDTSWQSGQFHVDIVAIFWIWEEVEPLGGGAKQEVVGQVLKGDGGHHVCLSLLHPRLGAQFHSTTHMVCPHRTKSHMD